MGGRLGAAPRPPLLPALVMLFALLAGGFGVGDLIDPRNARGASNHQHVQIAPLPALTVLDEPGAIRHRRVQRPQVLTYLLRGRNPFSGSVPNHLLQGWNRPVVARPR